MRILPILLSFACLSQCFALSIANFHSDYHELVRIEISGPHEVRIVFPHDVAQQWAIDEVSSYVRFNSHTKLSVWPGRRRGAADRRCLYARTAEPLKPGQYTYHFAINSVAPPRSGYDVFVAVKTGAFQIVR